MPYQLTGVTIRTDNSAHGMAQIDALWDDVLSGKLPLLGDGAPDRFPAARYSGYENGPDGAFDLTILSVTADFLTRLEAGTASGQYRKYEVRGAGSLKLCAQRAWEQVWTDQNLRRTFRADYEITIPAAYAGHGSDCCLLYIAV